MPITRVVNDFLANSTQYLRNRYPDVTVLANGRYLATWSGDDSFFQVVPYDMRGRIFNSDGTPAGDDFFVAPADLGSQYDTHVTALASGGFVATWGSNDQVGDVEMRARVFDASGAPLGADFLVSTTAPGPTRESDCVGLADGRFVITWSGTSAANGYEVYGRVYNANGSAAGAEFVVNTTSPGSQMFPTLGNLANGGFVAVWASDIVGSRDEGLRARIYDAAGAAAGPDILIADLDGRSAFDVEVAVLKDGRFRPR
jgi:hypothetical protein